jgi:cell division protein FtsZ
MGILTVGIVTKPFSFEGKKRAENAEEGLRRMKEVVDTLIVIPNDKIYNLVDKKTTFKQAFTMIDKVLFLGVQGISDLIIKPGDINIDFADIKNVMIGSGNALLGIGYGAGEKRAVDAAREAIENPLLETNLDGAKKVIFAVSGGNDLTPIEVQEAASIVEEILDPEAEMIW